MNLAKFENFLLKDDENQKPIILRALVPPTRVGVLLGTKGHTHQQIQDIHNVRILLKPQGEEIEARLMFVFGRPTNTAGACREALIRMYRAFSTSVVQSFDFGLHFLVPAELVRLLLQEDDEEQERCPLAKIQSESKAKIYLYREPLPNTTDYILKIFFHELNYSTLESFETAVRLLALFISDHIDVAQSPYNIYYEPQASNFRPPQQDLFRGRNLSLDFPVKTPSRTVHDLNRIFTLMYFADDDDDRDGRETWFDDLDEQPGLSELSHNLDESGKLGGWF